MVGGLVYLSTSLGQVAALDAGTGELVWSYDPHSYDRLDRPGNMGWQHRGVSYWEDEGSDDARIFIATHDLLLVALNARTGRQYADFGADGAVDLSASLGRPVDRARFTHSQPLAIAGDTVIVGSIVQDTSLRFREADPGHVRGFDVTHRRDEVDLPHHPAGRGVRRGHLAQRIVALQRPLQRLGHDGGRRGAGLRLPADGHPDQRLVRRHAPRRQPLRREHHLRRRRDGRTHLALPGHTPRAVGLRLPHRRQPA